VLTPSLFIDMHVPSHEIEWSCICVLGISSLALSTLFFCSDFGNVWTVLCFCFALFCLFVCLFVFVFVCVFSADHKNQTHITRINK
jgi:cytochrome c oxidase subunit IV